MDSATPLDEAELVTGLQVDSDLVFDYLVTYYQSSVGNELRRSTTKDIFVAER